MDLKQLKAVILGHAVGDALGVPVEFCSRDSIASDPVTDMRGFGTFSMPPGAWSDDTSMSLCALDSLSSGQCDLDDVMGGFCRWYRDGEYTPTGEAFDVGGSCLESIAAYSSGKSDIRHCGQSRSIDNGNGSLMRINPFALFLADKQLPLNKKLRLIHEASALTHAHELSMQSCGIYSFVLWALLKDPRKDSVALGLKKADAYYGFSNTDREYCAFNDMLLNRIGRIYQTAEGCRPPQPVTRDDIESGGYVVNTLEAAVWCLLNTDSYRDCVLTAVNLGFDTDTTAAVAGGLAGALYGLESIPGEWLDTLLRRDYIESMCQKAYLAWQ